MENVSVYKPQELLRPYDENILIFIGTPYFDKMSKQVEKLGYNTHFEMKVAADSSDRLDFVKDFIEAEARPAAGGQYIFDAKA